jgi:hypothetical protein
MRLLLVRKMEVLSEARATRSGTPFWQKNNNNSRHELLSREAKSVAKGEKISARHESGH